MSSSHVEYKAPKMPQSPTEKIDLICATAREKDKDLLDKLVEDNLCIDIFDGSETAIQRLALEGDTESVEFLIKYFDADVNRAALGAAEGGHQQLLDSMLARCQFKFCCMWRGLWFSN